MSSPSINIASNINVSTVGLCLVALLAVYITHWLYKWRNPKCSGSVLPPGSMGLPFIGETLQLILPNASIDLPPFIKDRLKRYGPIFRTSVAGRPVIITADRDFNYFILNQIGKLVDTWSLDTFAELFDQATQSSRKYIRDLTLRHFGVEAIKGKLLPGMESVVCKTLASWANQEYVEVKGEAVKMAIDFAKRQMVSDDLENSPLKLSEMFNDIVEGLMSFPLKIPGTTHYKCLKIHKEVKRTLGDVLKNRRTLADQTGRDPDLLDNLLQDSSFLSDDFMVQVMFGLLFVTSDSISTTMALAFKFLAEHPAVLEELTAEHNAILENRENLESGLTWEEYKSMTYTRQVINELLRLANIAPGLFRRALKDIPVNGYTIPKGWVIMVATSALHMNSDDFDKPLEFIPGRWKDLHPSIVQKCFMPFGIGMKQCAGADYSRVFVATFLHVLVTKYKWEKVKGGKIVRSPIIRFPDGLHYNISQKNK